jgi:hypothetical protein
LDRLTLILLLLALMALVILRTIYLQWRIQRMARQIVAMFAAAGAVAPASARTLEEFGLTLQPRFFGPRDDRPHAIRGLLRAGVLLDTGDDRFYLSPAAYEAHRSRVAG